MSIDDKELDDYLRGDSALSRHYRSNIAGNSGQPPEELDRAVLAQARAAAHVQKDVVRFTRRRRFTRIAPFALAATALLTFALVREAGLDSTLSLQETAKENSAPLTSDAVSSAPVAVETPISSLPEPPPPAAASEERKQEMYQPNLPREAATANAAAGAVAAPKASSRSEPLMKAQRSRPLQDAPVNILQEADESRRQAPAALEPEPMMTTSSDKPPAPTPVARTKKEAESIESPEMWLEAIRKLRAEGKTVEAEAQLQRFLQVHPHYFKEHPEVSRP